MNKTFDFIAKHKKVFIGIAVLGVAYWGYRKIRLKQLQQNDVNSIKHEATL